MKLFKKAKKGFTLIELVVVIAVIAILSTIAIISFISVTNKAKESHDNQIIDQVNLSLKADEALNGKPKTMHRALEALKEDGFLPANFGDLRGTAKDYTFAYSLKENKFVALKGGKISYPSGVGEHANHELWKIAESTTGLDDGYSYYLRGEDKTGPVSVKAGFDAGDNTGLTEVNYSNNSEQEVVIRTNGGTLTVNAPADTVKHFGDADSVNIIKVASNSYHENGTVPFIQISQGRVEIEPTGDVNGIHVANVQTVDANGNITKETNTFSQDVALTLNGKDVKLSRDTIGTTISSPVMVCQVQEQSNSASEYIWLVGDGTIENQKVYVTSTSAAPDTTNPSGTTTSNASESVVAIANNAVNTGTAENPAYEAQESGKSAVDAQVASALKGTGTKADPFKVFDFETMQKISDFYTSGHYYYKVAIEKTNNGIIDCKNNWTPVNVNGNFDGSGVRFINLNKNLFNEFQANQDEEIVIKDFTATFDSLLTGTGATICSIEHDDTTCNVRLENINVHGRIISTYATSSFIGWGSDGTQAYNYKFINCYSDATLVASNNTASAFIYHPYCDSTRLKIELENSYYDGKMITPDGKGQYILYVYSAANITISYTEQFAQTHNLENLYTGGTPLAGSTDLSKKYNVGSALMYSRDVSVLTNNNAVGELPVLGSAFSVNKAAGASKAIITYNFGPNPGNLYSTFISEIIDISNVETGSPFTSQKVKYYNIAINGTEVVSGISHGHLPGGINEELKLYNLNWSGSDGTVYTADVKVIQFDSVNNVMSTTMYTIPYAPIN